ncbi:MAG: 4-alpha-glucanotransferase [Acidobacteriota bacterium]
MAARADSKAPEADPRAAGILLHPTSLPGPFGIGDLGPEADRFLQWAASAGQTLWQVLPLGPTGHGDAPYGCSSAFAGNPLLISPELLRQEGLLPAWAPEARPASPDDRVDFDSVIPWKERILRQSWEHFREHANSGFRGELDAFCAAPEQADWLSDWALFAALKTRHHGRGWLSWGHELRTRDPGALERARRELSAEIAYQTYLQFLFFRQWGRVKRAANELGIAVMGDIPIYTALDSADVWANERLFTLDAEGFPTSVSGVPPDYFSATGQLWGNPLYRWDRIAEEGYGWWIARIRANLRACDLLRIDHFRAFAQYWAVPASERTALNGQWLPGPGRALFDAVRADLGSLPIVAEDLGIITEDVRELLGSIGIPGMKVLQFAFYEPDSEYLPHRHVPNSVVYTGTHDNDTARGWYASLNPEERERVWDYLGSDGREIHWDLARAAYASVSRRAIVPMQDVLGLGSEARMNTPAEAAGNWRWRAPGWAFRPEDAARLRRMAVLTGRFRPAPPPPPEA